MALRFLIGLLPTSLFPGGRPPPPWILGYWMSGLAGGPLVTIFSLYSVSFFTDVVKIDPNSFAAVHVIYGLWNAVNDPVFGWMLDTMEDTGNRRLPVLKYGGPAWCLAFMVLWYPWSYEGGSWAALLHFFATMMLFDGFLTYVMIVKCALLADLCTNSDERMNLNNGSAIASLAGTFVGAMSFYFYDEANLGPIRAYCTVVMLGSAAAWYYSAVLLGCTSLMAAWRWFNSVSTA